METCGGDENSPSAEHPLATIAAPPKEQMALRKLPRMWIISLAHSLSLGRMVQRKHERTPIRIVLLLKRPKVSEANHHLVAIRAMVGKRPLFVILLGSKGFVDLSTIAVCHLVSLRETSNPKSLTPYPAISRGFRNLLCIRLLPGLMLSKGDRVRSSLARFQ